MKKELFEIKFNNGEEDGTSHVLDTMPCDKGFWLGENNYEICHATGIEVSWDGEWWNEYKDSTGCYHYGR